MRLPRTVAIVSIATACHAAATPARVPSAAGSGVADGGDDGWRELFHEVPVAVVPDASSPEAQQSTGHIQQHSVVLRTADGGVREGMEYDTVLPAGPNKTCPRGYRYWQEIHVAGCVFHVGPDKKCPPGYRYQPRDRCVSHDASTDFDRQDAATKLGGVNLDPCLAREGPERLGVVWITFAEDGRAITTRLEPPLAATALGACIEERLREVRVRPYKSGGPVTVSMSFTVRR
jgi:hypothetical protein